MKKSRTNIKHLTRILLFLSLWALAQRDALSASSPPGRVVSWGLVELLPDVRPGTVFTNIVCGYEHNVAITAQGTVVEWGSVGRSAPPTGLSNVVAVAGGYGGYGYATTIALKNDGQVVVWGNSFFASILTNVPAGLSGVQAVVNGGQNCFALRSNGTVVAWGSNLYGLTNVPAGLTNVLALAFGGHILALKSDGTVAAWGRDFDGQTDVLAGLTNVTAVAAGFGHSVALKNDGTVVAWGRENATNVPPGLNGVIRVFVSGDTTMALKNDGRVVVWGWSGAPTNVPPDLTGVLAMGCDNYGAVALRSNGTVVVWGAGPEGNRWGTRGLTNAPPGLSNIVDISVGDGRAFARKADGTFVGWGYNFSYLATVPPCLTDVVSLGSSSSARSYDQYFINGSGRLVDSGFVLNEKPADLSNVVALTKGGYTDGAVHTVALRGDGTVITWGDNNVGQLDLPEGLSNVVAVAAGRFHSAALRADGTVVAWGESGLGQTNVPAGLSGVKAVSAYMNFTLAQRSNGTMTAWGQVPPGQPALDNVVAISAGNAFCLALKSDGQVEAWGYNGFGQTEVPSDLSDVVAVSAGWFHSVALKSDGKVVVWGGEPSSRLIQAAPPGLKNVISISTAEHGTYALVLDPQLSAIRRTGDDIVLRFRSFAGQLYQIQYSPDLSPDSWLPLPGGDVTGDGQDIEVTDSNVIPGQAARFYRLVEVN